MSIHTPYKNKSIIRERMCRVAADFFGISRYDLTDPVVNLFVESLSEEVYKASGEIEQIENRILDKLSGLLSPGIETIGIPGHTVLHATPQNGKQEIDTLTEFRYTDKRSEKSFAFYPACDTTLLAGELRYFVYREVLYSMEKDLSKTICLRGNGGIKSETDTFWLGMHLDESVKDISGLTLFFDFQGLFDKEKYLNLLAYTTWHTEENEQLIINSGISAEKGQTNDALKLFSEYDFFHKINKSVKNQYDNRFISVSQSFNIDNKRTLFPKELETSFPGKTAEWIGQPLLWLKVNCPQGFTPEIIESLQVCINAFPVVNRKLISKTIEINKSVPIIPLETHCNESFISLHRMTDSNGKIYVDIPVKNTDDCHYGIYSLRKGGCERFDKRDASDFLAESVDSFGNEVSAFFQDRQDTKSDLTEIEFEANRLVKELRQVLSDSEEHYEATNYLFVVPEKEHEIYFVDYWITNGEDVNHIRTGSLFFNYSEHLLIPASIRTLFPVTGGKYAPQSETKKKEYRKSLAERVLLVTDDDVKQFCVSELGDLLSEIEIKRGIIPENGTRTSFLSTTDIYVTLSAELKEQFNEQDRLRLLKMLESYSPATCHYRLFINKNQTK